MSTCHRTLRFVRSLLSLLSLLALSAVPAFAGSPSSISLAVSGGGSVAFGTVVTLTATVRSNGYRVSPGRVQFCDVTGGAACQFLHLLATTQLNASGVATYKFTPRSGTHLYQAIFLGARGSHYDANGDVIYDPLDPYNPITGPYDVASSMSSTSTLVVTGNSTTTLVKTGSQGNYTLTARVTGEGLSFPTGTVSFKDTSNSNAVVRSGTLAAGTSAQYPKSITTAGTGPSAMATGDFNGDGYLDIAVANQTGNSVTILQGNGDGTFTALANPTAVASPTFLAAGDFNNDGLLDLVVAASNGDVSLKGNGDGSFTAVATSGGYAPFVLHDSSDGNLDRFAIQFDGTGALDWRGVGNGTFGKTDDYEEVECPYAQFSYNLSGLAIFNEHLQNAGLVSVGLTDINNGQGLTTGVITFASLPHPGDCYGLSGDSGSNSGFTYTGKNPVAVASGDFNGDGIADFVVVNQGDNTLSIFLGNAHGSVTTAASPATGSTPTSVVVGDFDGDGITDLAVSNSGDSTIILYKGAGDGTFTTLTTLSVGSAPSFLVAGDLNGNGQMDLAVSDPTDNTATIYLTTPAATATATSTGVDPGIGLHFVDAVFPSDTHYFSSVSPTVDLSHLNTSTTVSSVSPSSVATGGSTTLTATVTNTEFPATYPVGSVAFSTTAGGMTYAACTAAVTNGVASCAYTATHTGANTITAAFTPTDPANFSASADATGKPLTVTAVPLGSFTVGGFPSPDRNGTAHTVTVTAYDVNGALFTGYTGTVTLTSTDALATLPAAYTFGAGDNGAHSFTVKLATGGTHSITATDSATGIHASQSNIVVDDFIWVLNSTGVTQKFDEAGTNVATGGTAGTAAAIGGIAVDASGSAWSVRSSVNALVMTPRSGSTPTTLSGTGGLNGPAAVAVDGSNRIWVVNRAGNSLSHFSNSGLALTPSSGITSGNLLSAPSAISIDEAGSIWIASTGNNSVIEVIGAAAPVAGPVVQQVTNGTAGSRP